jgi:hypothetical protein
MMSLSRISLGNSTETLDIQTNKKHTSLRLRKSMTVLLPLSGENMKVERFTWNTDNYLYTHTQYIVITQKTAISIFTTEKTSNLIRPQSTLP